MTSTGGTAAAAGAMSVPASESFKDEAINFPIPPMGSGGIGWSRQVQDVILELIGRIERLEQAATDENYGEDLIPTRERGG